MHSYSENNSKCQLLPSVYKWLVKTCIAFLINTIYESPLLEIVVDVHLGRKMRKSSYKYNCAQIN